MNRARTTPAPPERSASRASAAPFDERGRNARREEQRGGVEDHDILLLARRRAIEQRLQPPRILGHIAAGDGLERGALQPGVFRHDLQLFDRPVRQAQRAGLGVERNFVEPRAVDDQRLFDPHRVERLRDPPKHLRIGDPEQLDGRAGRIDARPQQIHDRPHFELPPDQRGVLHPGVVGGREQEAEAGLVEQRSGLGWIDLDLRAERLQHIGRAAARADAAVAVLGDGQAARRGDEPGRGRHVDQPRPVAASAAAIGVEIVRAGRTAKPPR